MISFFKILRPDQWAWLHAKFALLLWGIAFFVVTPVQVAAAIDEILAILISASILIGVTMSTIGLFMSVSKKIARVKLGLALEFSGLWIALTGPVAYFVTRFYLIFTPGGTQGIALTVLSYTVCALTLVRIVQVAMSRKRV